MSNNITLRSLLFDGDEADFTTFINAVDNTTRGFINHMQLKYELGSDEERAEMEENGDFDPDNSITAPDDPANATQQQDWRIYQTEQRIFKSWFFSTVSDEVATHISNVRNVDFASLTPRDMRAHLLAVYGNPSHTTNREQLNKLFKPFTMGEDLQVHLRTFDKVLEFFTRTNFPLDDLFKYEFLVRSMATHDEYSKYITQYEITGTKTYGSLTRALLAHRSGLATANAVRQMHQATVHPLSAAATTGPTTTTLDGYKVVKPSKYCWSHGISFHTSADCKKRKEGHKEKATITNRMGGSKSESMPRLLDA